PAYIVDGYAYLNSYDLGRGWTSLLRSWLHLEEAMEYANGKAIPTLKKRPVAVSDWLQRARSPSWSPDSYDAYTASREFWSWWAALQPKWRAVTVDQTPFREVHRPNAAGQSWGSLQTSGINGSLSILASLAWWGKACDGNVLASGEWDFAVADVQW
ncbi:hypothetical protein BDZ89DRAFT_914450, partial [Hymenopellis radicata]